VVVEGYECFVRAPYEMRDAIKSTPERWWDSRRRCWVLPAEDADLVAAYLRDYGCTVTVERAPAPPPPPPPPPTTPPVAWATALLRAVGPDREDRVVRALARVLHPDVEGGSTVLMQQLNDARCALSRRA